MRVRIAFEVIYKPELKKLETTYLLIDEDMYISGDMVSISIESDRTYNCQIMEDYQVFETVSDYRGVVLLETKWTDWRDVSTEYEWAKNVPDDLKPQLKYHLLPGGYPMSDIK